MIKVFLAPIGNISSFTIESITKGLMKKLSADVEVIDLQIDLESVKSIERSQYYSTKILASAITLTEHYNGKIMILVDVDLYVPVFTFLFGEAQLNGKHAIVSLFRLHEEFYSGEINNDLFYSRVLKEVFHELGHNYGLIHCKDWNCVMHSSTGIEEVDIKGDFYCSSCSKSIIK